MYNYLSLPLVIGISLFSTTYALSLEVLENQKIQQFTGNSTYLLATKKAVEETARLENFSYLGLMNAGYQAYGKHDYLEALNYFRQALNIQPGDLSAKTAIKNISSDGFDLYMQAGYAADRIRDYTTALQNFQKALQIQPDSWYAEQAVSNLSLIHI